MPRSVRPRDIRSLAEPPIEPAGKFVEARIGALDVEACEEDDQRDHGQGEGKPEGYVASRDVRAERVLRRRSQRDEPEEQDQGADRKAPSELCARQSEFPERGICKNLP